MANKKKPFFFRGVLYDNFDEACIAHGVSPLSTICWIRNNSIKDKVRGLEHYLESKSQYKVHFRGVCYDSLNDACAAYNINAYNVYDMMRSRHIKDKAEGIEAYLIWKEKMGFLFRGVKYRGFAEACRAYDTSSSNVLSWMKRRNMTDKAEGLEAYLNWKAQNPA